ncbi:MAG: hypothetical protein H6Q70_3717 [Firmicutes bacterium]|nr:hypothetical protein [Bacillota bacterium]
MATVGEQLTAPETGWKRYDDTNSNISYLGTGWDVDSTYSPYNGGRSRNTAITSDRSIRFNFTGSNLRIIGILSSNWSNNLQISVDGITESFSQYNNATATSQVLNYEKLNLSNGEHSVIITNTASVYWGLDAIDIDETGELKPYAPIVAPTNLTATAGDSEVTLSWTAVDGATSYIVKRSTTSGGTYTTIASDVTGTSYVDTSVTNGTTYYYVVTAVNAEGESNNSNEASATPVDSSKLLLRVTVIDSSDHDYQLTSTEVDAFVNWFMNYTSSNTAGYMLAKKNGTQDSKEYIAFDKIISFEVLD